MSPTRRNFLKISTGATAFASLARAASPLLARAAFDANPGDSGRVLVVLQVAGGNDGLNTVVPYEDDQYGRSRTTLRLTANQVHKIGSGLGFHPELVGFARLFQEGRLSVVQGVGYPRMERGDHNLAMQNWQTAGRTPGEKTGWLGRAADLAADPDTGNVPAVFVGPIAQPLSIHARRTVVPTLRSAKDWTLLVPDSTLPPSATHASNPLLNFAASATAAGRVDAARVASVLGSGRGFDYPQYALAQSFQTVAQLIRADIGIRICLVEIGGVSPGNFDNHSNQAENHAVVLRELSASIAAFCDDLARDKVLDRTLLMTYSEFGRQLTENGRHGTGHGAAAPVFLAGGKLKGGLVGAHPSLSDLEADAPKPHTDFRALYATVLECWLGMKSEPILGRQFAPLDVLA